MEMTDPNNSDERQQIDKVTTTTSPPPPPLPFTEPPAKFTQGHAWEALCATVNAPDLVIMEDNSHRDSLTLAEMATIERAFSANFPVVCSMTGDTPSLAHQQSEFLFV